MEVQGFAGQGQVGLAECFILRRVSVNELRNFLWECFPVDDQLGFTGLFAQSSADAVDAHNRSVLLADDLDQTSGVQDHGLAVSTQVVFEGLDTVGAILLFGLLGRESDREDLGSQ